MNKLCKIIIPIKKINKKGELDFVNNCYYQK